MRESESTTSVPDEVRSSSSSPGRPGTHPSLETRFSDIQLTTLMAKIALYHYLMAAMSHVQCRGFRGAWGSVKGALQTGVTIIQTVIPIPNPPAEF